MDNSRDMVHQRPLRVTLRRERTVAQLHLLLPRRMGSHLLSNNNNNPNNMECLSSNIRCTSSILMDNLSSPHIRLLHLAVGTTLDNNNSNKLSMASLRMVNHLSSSISPALTLRLSNNNL
jgi:hypothetical protein